MRLKQKIKNEAINELTNVELALFVYISRRQGLDGLLEDLHIKTVEDHTGHSLAGLYNALYSLEEKGFISIDKWKMINYDVVVLNNHFTCFVNKGNKSVDPYMNLDSKLFEDGLFYFQNIHVKRFLLTFMGFKHNFKISKEKLREYKVFKYLDDLKYLFNITKKSDGIYVFSKKQEAFGKDINIQYRYFFYKITRFIENWGILPSIKKIQDVVFTACRFVEEPWVVVNALKRLKKENKGLNCKYFNAIVSGTVKF